MLTPHLDGLLAEGLVLERMFTYQFCSPSRASLISGRLPIHIKEDNDWVGGVPLAMTTLPERLQAAGYQTAFAGKWHLGSFAANYTPAARGFDSSVGYFHASEDHYEQTTSAQVVDWSSGEPVLLPQYAHVGGTDWFRDRGPCTANGTQYNLFTFMEEFHAVLDGRRAAAGRGRGRGRGSPAPASQPSQPSQPARPLFFFMSFNNNHAPLQVPAEYRQRYPAAQGKGDNERLVYAAMTTAVDEALGNITARLKSEGMWNTTLLVVQSDNGGPVYAGGGANTHPLRGGKISDFNGGVMVPAMISGGVLPPAMRGRRLTGATSYMHICDWLATLLSMAGERDASDARAAAVVAATAAYIPPIDSLDMSDMLLGRNSTSPRTELALSSGLGRHDGIILTKGALGAVVATIAGRPYKLIVGRICEDFAPGPVYPNSSYSGPDPRELCRDCGATGCLFDIEADLGENKDLSGDPAHADVLAAMQAKHRAMLQTRWSHVNLPSERHNGSAMIAALRAHGGYFTPVDW